MKILLAHSKLICISLCCLMLTLYGCKKDNPLEGKLDENGFPILEEDLILDADRKFINYVIPQEKYDEFIEDDIDFSFVSTKIFSHFKDNFDFIFIFADEDERPPGAAFGRTAPVTGNVRGLGSNTFDNSIFFGLLDFDNEDKQIQTIVYMPLVEYIRTGPFLHEIAHNWANRGFIPTVFGDHWGYSDVGGQLGGFDELVDLGNGTYIGKMNGENGFGLNANGGNSVPYANTELYLMGMIPFSELEPVQVAINPNNIEALDGFFNAESIETFTPEALIADHGERSPSFSDAQKSFRAISVIVSTSPISEERKERANELLDEFVTQGEPSDDWHGNFGYIHNFWTATNGVGRIGIDIRNDDLR